MAAPDQLAMCQRSETDGHEEVAVKSENVETKPVSAVLRFLPLLRNPSPTCSCDIWPEISKHHKLLHIVIRAAHSHPDVLERLKEELAVADNRIRLFDSYNAELILDPRYWKDTHGNFNRFHPWAQTINRIIQHDIVEQLGANSHFEDKISAIETLTEILRLILTAKSPVGDIVREKAPQFRWDLSILSVLNLCSIEERGYLRSWEDQLVELVDLASEQGPDLLVKDLQYTLDTFRSETCVAEQDSLISPSVKEKEEEHAVEKEESEHAVEREEEENCWEVVLDFEE
ncbi:hypothetical protein B0T21DRAFT_412121 [Apiosordaria backusii]|uniref:Uncharacterized protein n=1 Tax=Apiosordaria backusii TaxID=314023 RepID=A0AA40ED16_9PEZI|nr:hypothetical protein B0T21DRAFT_412121 [Apiosordaria backusii]